MRWGVSVALLLVAGPASAFPLGTPSMAVGPTGSDIKVETAFEGLPPTGYLPVRVSITNRGTRPAEHRVELSCTITGIRGSRREDEHAITVPAQASLTQDLLAPLPPQARQGYGGWANCNVVVIGPEGRRSFSSSGRIPGAMDADRPTVGFAYDLPEPDKCLAGAVPKEVHVIRVDPSLMPGEWRGFLGLDALWMRQYDLRYLSPEARVALVQWVAQGGALVVVGQLEDGEVQAPLPGFPFTKADFELRRFGLGHLEVLGADEGGQDITDLLSSLRARVLVSEHPRRGAALQRHVALERWMERVQVRRPLIVAFLVVFWLLMGPVNFFLLAPKARRVRLLVTTPVLGVAASLALVMLILLQDGVGGAGRRAQVVLLMPRLNAAMRGQAQLSNTGLIVSGAFPLPASVHLAGLVQDEEERQDLERRGDRASGDWFRTRTTQGQWLQELAPARERVERVEPATEDAPPVLVSSLGYPLEAFFYTDHLGRLWGGEGLAPGATARLAPLEQVEPWFATAVERYPGPMQDALRTRLPAKGWLVGKVLKGPAPWPTHPAVAFDDEPGLVVVEVVPPGEGS
ncbi:MAG: hypothetical protein H6730_31855 [Deltaproteobacteria bacterium]|nr:hypothetical protein [Deltaproteobacteria bacterium]